MDREDQGGSEHTMYGLSQKLYSQDIECFIKYGVLTYKPPSIYFRYFVYTLSYFYPSDYPINHVKNSHRDYQKLLKILVPKKTL